MRLKSKKGFTLVELLIVIAVIGVLSAVAIPVFTGNLEQARLKVCAYNVQIIYRSHAVHELLGEGLSLADVLHIEYHDGEGLCPSGGTYSVTVESLGGKEILRCSVHGRPDYTFEYSGTDEGAINSLGLLYTAAADYLTNFVKANNYRLNSSGAASSISISPTMQQQILSYNGSGWSLSGILIRDTLADYLGNDTIFGVDADGRLTISNLRIAYDADMNVISVSYKKGNYGYVEYADGSMYKLSNAKIYASDPPGSGATITQVIMDKQVLLTQHIEGIHYWKIN